MSKIKIKKGDQVVVLAGKYRGVKGKVLRVLPAANRAIVERVNVIKRHTRPNPQRQIQGGVVEREAPIHISNLMLLDAESGKPTRIGRSRGSDGKVMRVSKRSGATLT